jgi:signal transduction histidine kinase
MEFQFRPYVIPNILSVLLTASLLMVGWRDRNVQGRAPFLALLGSITIWSFGTTMRLSVVSLEAKRIWLNVMFVGVTGTPVALLLFALAFADYEEYVTPRTVAGLSIEPAVMLPIFWTNRYHNFFETRHGTVEHEWNAFGTEIGPFAVMDVTHGLGFKIQTVYTYLLVLTASALLVRTAIRNRHLYRRQSAIVITAVVGPLVGNIIYISPIIETQIDPTHFGLTIASSLLAVAVFDFRLLDLAPIARDVVVDELREAVVVIDNEGRIVDANAAAGEILHTPAGELVGRHVESVFEEYPALIECCRSVTNLREEIIAGGRHFDVRVTPIGEANTNERSRENTNGAQEAMPAPKPAGRAVIFHDITDHKRRQTQLERQNERLDRFAGVVSHDLRNPVAVAKGHLDLADDEIDSEHIETAQDAIERIETISEEVLELARHGDEVTETTLTELHSIATSAWKTVDHGEATLCVEHDLTFEADPDRLQRLFENLFRNAIEHGRDDVRIAVGTLDGKTGFYIEDDGPGLPEDRDDLFEYGATTETDGTGFGLAIVRSIAEAHGWEVGTGTSEHGGARFEFTRIDSETTQTA